MIYRYQANPFAKPEMKLIALLEDRKAKIEIRNSADFRFSIFDFRSSAPPQAAGPLNADQVMTKVYDAVNGALKVNGTLAGGSANPTPHNADQVLFASYDAVNGALRMNCVTGCNNGAATSLTFGSTNQTLSASAATAAGQCLVSSGTGPYTWGAGSCSGTASTNWSALVAGTNTGNAFLIGAGGSLGTTGTGTISATSVTGLSVTSGKTLSVSNTLTLAGTDNSTLNVGGGGTLGTFAFQNYATPPPIGGTTPAAGAFTTLSASNTVSGGGFTSLFASPPAIGGTTPAAGSFTTLSATGNLTTNVTGSTQCLQANNAGVVSGTGGACGSGGGGSMTWPSAAGIANYSGSNSWGTSYSASNQVPLSFLSSPLVYHSSTNGMACNDSADDTSAFNTLLSTVNSAGGGTIYLDGMCLLSSAAITFPTSSGAGSINQMAPIRITGASPGVTQDWGANGLTAVPSGLDLRYNASPAKLVTLGTGNLEIDHITIKDGGTDCAPFALTTNTVVNIHDNTFQGAASQLNACNDAVIFGGTGSTGGNLTTSMFQGYHSLLFHNYMSNIRRAALLENAANNVWVVANSCDTTCGSNLTTAITAATNANPTVLTVTGHGFVVGSTFNINIFGATGNWTPINGNFTATVVDANDFSIPVNATSFGSLTGSPQYYDGAWIDFEGSNPVNSGSVVQDNLVEMHYYPIFAQVTYGQALQFDRNGLFDAGNGYNICDYKLETHAANTGNANTPGSQIIDGYRSGGQPEQCGIGGPWTQVRSIWQGIFPNSVTVPATSSSTTGVFIIGTNPVLHAYPSGGANLFAGVSAGNFTMTGTGNTGLGASALPALTSGSNNTAAGDGAGNALTTGGFNAFFGQGAGIAVTTQNSNACMGARCLYTATTGVNQASAFGAYGLYKNTAGPNTCIGYYCGYNLATGTHNFFGGWEAGMNELGSQNTYVGDSSGPSSSATLTNAFALGYQATPTTSNTGVLGNASVTDIYAGGTGAAANLHAAQFYGGLTNATGLPNSGLVNSSATVNGSTCTLGSSCSISVLLSGLGNPNASTTLSMGAYPFTLSAFNFTSGSIANGLSVTDQTTNASAGFAFSVAPQNGAGSTWNGIQVGQGTQATSSNNYNSTVLGFTGNFWNSSATTPATIGFYDVLGSGNNPTQTLTAFNCTSSSTPACPGGSTGNIYEDNHNFSWSKFNVVNAVTGYQVGGAAAAGARLRGNGTNFVKDADQAPFSAASLTSDILCDANNCNGTETGIGTTATMFANYLTLNATSSNLVDGVHPIVVVHSDFYASCNSCSASQTTETLKLLASASSSFSNPVTLFYLYSGGNPTVSQDSGQIDCTIMGTSTSTTLNASCSFNNTWRLPAAGESTQATSVPNNSTWYVGWQVTYGTGNEPVGISQMWLWEEGKE
jgi:hypothetical protein